MNAAGIPLNVGLFADKCKYHESDALYRHGYTPLWSFEPNLEL